MKYDTKELEKQMTKTMEAYESNLATIRAGQANAAQALHQIAAAAVVLLPHLFNVPVAVAHGLDGGVLAGGGGRHDSILVQAGHSGNDGGRGAGIAHAV